MYKYLCIVSLLLSSCGDGSRGESAIPEINQNTAPGFIGIIDYAVDENSSGCRNSYKQPMRRATT